MRALSSPIQQAVFDFSSTFPTYSALEVHTLGATAVGVNFRDNTFFSIGPSRSELEGTLFWVQLCG
jgi:hypothetical protein